MTTEDKKLVARMKEIRDLIAEFGLTLHGYDPGITASLKDNPKLRGDGWGGEAITFNGTEWKWLEPLLQELHVRRKNQAVDVERLVEWLVSENRKDAGLAFTAGPERQAAYWMEMAMRQAMVDLKHRQTKKRKEK